MRYSSAVVLSTLAAGQAAAASINHRHAGFHERRSAEIKRDADSAIDWTKVAIDLKDVDWDKIDWKSVFASPTPAAATPTPAAPEAKKPEPTPEEQKPAPAATTPAPAAPSVKVQTANTDTKSDNALTDLFYNVGTIANKIGVLTGKNDKSNNGGIWVGTDSAWQADFINDANEDGVIYCWKASGFSGMSIKSVQPDISVGLKPGQKVSLSFAENVPAACAPAFADTVLSNFAGLKQTWWEVTFGPTGAFDVSRNVYMKGRNISSKGSKCTSDMNTCVFKCQDANAESCEKGYDLYACGAGSGGGSGFDPVMQGTGGGCSMGHDGEKVTVSFS